MISRRQLVIAVGASPLVAPFRSLAQQQGKVWRIGILSARSPSGLSNPDPYFDAFVRGMRDLGYADGKNLAIEWRFADGKYELLPGLAVELVQSNVELIVSHSTPGTHALQQATSTIPIVMTSVNDPLGSGFIKSLSRPGGNITGMSLVVTDLSQKYLEMLKTMLPKLSRVAVLVNPGTSSHIAILNNLRAAAQKLAITIVAVEVVSASDLERGFALMVRERTEALIVANDSLFNAQRKHLADLALKNRMPSIIAFREYVEAGGLMSYGQNLPDSYRRAAVYVDKILKGATPGDLPVEQPTKFELVINARTAKALGLKIPQSLLISADKVIE